MYLFERANVLKTMWTRKSRLHQERRLIILDQVGYVFNYIRSRYLIKSALLQYVCWRIPLYRIAELGVIKITRLIGCTWYKKIHNHLQTVSKQLELRGVTQMCIYYIYMINTLLIIIINTLGFINTQYFFSKYAQTNIGIHVIES